MDFIVIFEARIQLYDVRVVTVLKNFDFLLERISAKLTFVKFYLIIGLNSYKNTCLFMLGTVYLTKCSLANKDRCSKIFERRYILNQLKRILLKRVRLSKRNSFWLILYWESSFLLNNALLLSLRIGDGYILGAFTINFVINCWI